MANAAASSPVALAASSGATATPERAEARLSPLTGAVACASRLISSPPADDAFAAAVPEVPVALAGATPLPKMLRSDPLPPSAVAVALAAPLPTEVAVAIVLPPSPPGPALAAPPLPPTAKAVDDTVPTPVEVAMAFACRAAIVPAPKLPAPIEPPLPPVAFAVAVTAAFPVSESDDVESPPIPGTPPRVAFAPFPAVAPVVAGGRRAHRASNVSDELALPPFPPPPTVPAPPLPPMAV